MRPINFFILLLLAGCANRPGNNFEILDLSNKGLQYIPDSVFTHKKLEVLYLGNGITLSAPLSSVPADSTGMVNLNHITRIPDAIAKLSRLRVLDISDNELSSIPKAITKLEQLDSLNISFNKNLNIVNELPVLEKLQSLRWLNITETEFNEKTLAYLRHSLYKTRIITSLEELEYDAAK